MNLQRPGGLLNHDHVQLFETLAHVERERIPERVVHELRVDGLAAELYDCVCRTFSGLWLSAS